MSNGRPTSLDSLRELHGPHEVALQPGDTLAGYQVIGRIGEGASAVIFEVEHHEPHGPPSRWAAKVLRPAVLAHQFVRDKFEAEIRILTRLDHPNIVRVVDSVRHDAYSACIMSLVQGSTLEAYLPLHPGGLSEVLALSIALQVVDAITYAHAAGFVHRDLKPSNILLEQAPHGTLRAVVADFGLAKILGEASKTRTGVRLGTIAYMAPEQIQDASRVDGRADVYALGITLYECLTGALPFPYRSVYELIQAQLTRDVPSVRNVRPDLAHAWDHIIARACAKQMSDRYPSAEAMLGDLQALVAQLGLVDRNTVAIEPVRVDSGMSHNPLPEAYAALSRGHASVAVPHGAPPPPERRTLMAPGPFAVAAGAALEPEDPAQASWHDEVPTSLEAALPESAFMLRPSAEHPHAQSATLAPQASFSDALHPPVHTAASGVTSAWSTPGAERLSAEALEALGTAPTPPAPSEAVGAAEPEAPAAQAAQPVSESGAEQPVRASRPALASSPGTGVDGRRAALDLVKGGGPSRATLVGFFVLVALGLAALFIGLYFATR